MKDSREHILSTTFQLFLCNSYKEVTMSELVKESGLSKGAFYYYFSSKEQLFEEVINHFYGNLMQVDYSQYAHDSLLAFYCDYLAGFKQRINRHKELAPGESSLRANHYQLIFDALKRLPAFREMRAQRQEQELAEWSIMVRQARASSEIRTSLSDTQVAKLFIYLSDGIAIKFMLQNQTDELLLEMNSAFAALYQQLTP
jgi:TetR/AcrR family transcriptional repressor of nem operon